MSPKIDTKADELEIDKIENELPKAITRDSDGNIVRYNPAMMLIHRRRMRLVYKKLLAKLDSRGMLTFTPKDYKSVMGDFSKA